MHIHTCMHAHTHIRMYARTGSKSAAAAARGSRRPTHQRSLHRHLQCRRVMPSAVRSCMQWHTLCMCTCLCCVLCRVRECACLCCHEHCTRCSRAAAHRVLHAAASTPGGRMCACVHVRRGVCQFVVTSAQPLASAVEISSCTTTTRFTPAPDPDQDVSRCGVESRSSSSRSLVLGRTPTGSQSQVCRPEAKAKHTGLNPS